MIVGAQPSIFTFWVFWQLIPNKGVVFFLLFPIIFLIVLVILILGTIIISKIVLLIVNWIHPPSEGVFERNNKDKDYCAWSLRAVIRKWPLWLVRQLYLPPLENLVMKLLGAKVKLSSLLHEAWIATEFITIGNNVKIGQGTVITSSILTSDKLIIRNVNIEQNVIISAHAVINPGTNVGEGTIVDSNTITRVDQKLEKNAVYRGTPAEKVESNKVTIPTIEIGKTIANSKSSDYVEDEFLRAHSKELSIPLHFYIISGFIIIGGSFLLPAFLFYVILYGLVIPTLFAQPLIIASLLKNETYIISFLTPLMFITLYLLHLFFVALFTRIFYKLIDKRGPTQGIFDRNLHESSKILDYYHFGSFLMKYPIFAISRSPFPWLLNAELNFIKSNKIAKGTVLEETFIHSHVNMGRNSYLGLSAHMSNHLVDGVYGQENLTFIGIDIGKDSILNAITGGLPGTEIGEGSTLYPGCTTIKYDKIGDGGYYMGFPARRLKDEEIAYIFGDELDNE
jgi:acetyltransferase-like isoleucine patch superfamily enzyme